MFFQVAQFSQKVRYSLFVLAICGGFHTAYAVDLSQTKSNLTVSLRSYSGTFVTAEGGGGREVVVDRSAVGEWEILEIGSLTSKRLRSGDTVWIRASNGKFFSANCGGSTTAGCGQVFANRDQVLDWEMFVITKLNPKGNAFIRSGDLIALQTKNGTYCTAEGGGGAGSILICNRPARLEWETWTIKMETIGNHQIDVGPGGGVVGGIVVAPQNPNAFPLQMIDLSRLSLPAQGVSNQPIVLKNAQHQTLQGLRISNPNGPCIEINGGYDITITNSEIGPCGGAGILVRGATNVTIKDSYLHDTGGKLVEASNVKNLSVRRSQLARGTAGVYAQGSSGVEVVENRFFNMRGPFPAGQFVQFNQVTGSYNRIFCNVGENQMGQSNPEDAINLFKSSGTLESYLHVYGNKIKGGGPSTSGGGIMLGDGGSSSFIKANNNKLVNPGQYGVAVAGGSTIDVYNNQIYAVAQSFTNVGLYAWNQYPGTCENISIFSNEVKYLNKDGSQNGFWDGQNCGPIGGVTSNNLWADFLTPAILDTEVPACNYL